ncbi:M12 family metallopeptidase [Microvirga terrae]|uniref:M12 family metallopeptidase n=1 Tax=Microvirga terrae TaxID=2740529 RepID=A0ABY5RPW2_9HYPH|nr:M12 family metallopeptidase [Microvirga terrae]UVF18827.1 M12 family metallopeptidase [Microvirga terrae]
MAMINLSAKCLLATAILVCSAASAHDLRGLVAESSATDPTIAQKFEEIDRYRELLAARVNGQSESGLEGVVQRALLWPDTTISVCFFDGDQASQEQVVSLANHWTEGTGISFDFGPQGSRRKCALEQPSDIRVSFNGSGYWSYVGTKARFIPPAKQTLNLEGMGNGRTLSLEEKGTVLHEFGHALGFEHEHQSPIASCDAEFNWAYLYTALGWPKDKVDRNMRRLSQPSSKNGLFATAFDRMSIMLYALNPQAFLHPESSTCYIQRMSHDLSTVDKETMRLMYPAQDTDNSLPPASMPSNGTSDPVAINSTKQLNELLRP